MIKNKHHRDVNSFDIGLEDNIDEKIHDGYFEELDRKFNRSLDDEYDNNFLLGKKYKIILAIGTLALVMIMLVVVFIVVPKYYDLDKKGNKKVTNASIIEEEIPLATKDPYENMVKSRFTGTWVKEEIAENRPYAIMINNIKEASPQAGTSYADIMYEAVVEGGITRLMGIYSELPTQNVGSIRSARPYYVSLAKEYDAVFVHMGASSEAKTKISTLGVADIDGNTALNEGAIYRDTTVRAPHNVFTTASRMDSILQKLNYRTEYQGREDNHFRFLDEFTPLLSENICNKISIFFSSYTQPYFVYNEATKEYERYQFGTKHVDKNTGKQLSYTNIIIQYVNQWTSDNEGRQAMDIYNSNGKGLYISGGKYEEISWVRNEAMQVMKYKDSVGNLITVNPGKTYIALVPRDNKYKTVIQ